MQAEKESLQEVLFGNTKNKILYLNMLMLINKISIKEKYRNLIYAYVVFPNFKLSPDFDWSVATDGTHPFSGKAQQDYCDKEKKLFNIIIPGDNEEE